MKVKYWQGDNPRSVRVFHPARTRAMASSVAHGGLEGRWSAFRLDRRVRSLTRSRGFEIVPLDVVAVLVDEVWDVWFERPVEPLRRLLVDWGIPYREEGPRASASRVLLDGAMHPQVPRYEPVSDLLGALALGDHLAARIARDRLLTLAGDEQVRGRVLAAATADPSGPAARLCVELEMAPPDPVKRASLRHRWSRWRW